MEVPGRKLPAGPSSDDTTYCQPCEQDDKIISADAYCTVCKEFFCSTCANLHRKQKISRSHNLLDKSIMPTSISGQEDDDECIEPCDIHPKECIKYFCPTHHALICGHCAVRNHRSCQVEIISDISKVFKDSQEYGGIIKTVAKLFENISSCASDVEKHAEVVANLGEKEMKRLRRYREEVNKYFEEREKTLLKSIDQMKVMDEEILGTLKPKYEILKTKLAEIIVTLAPQENNTIQFFIETMRAKKVLESLQRDIDDINKDNVIHQYQFRIDTVTQCLITSDTGLGTIESIVAENTTSPAYSGTDLSACAGYGDGPKETKTTSEPTATVDLARLQFTPTANIIIKSQTDTSCRLSSILLLDGSMLLVADFKNNALNLVDILTCFMPSRISLQDGPWDMCILPKDRVAVTMGSKGIQFLDTRGQLNLGDRIAVNGDCRGIAHHEDKLIISYYDGHISILNMNGHVIRNLSSSAKMFENPLYLTVVCEGSTAFIFVSDFSKHTITKLDMNLKFVKTFRHPALQEPRSITALGNQLLICGYSSSIIMRLDLSTGQMKKLIGQSENIRHPLYAHYCPLHRTLYVTENGNNSVKVYHAIE